MNTQTNLEPVMCKVRKTILFDPPQSEKLDEVSTTTGVPVCELVRRSVTMYLDQQTGKQERVSA